MGSALMELMAPELDKAWTDGEQVGRREGIFGTVSILHNLGYGNQGFCESKNLGWNGKKKVGKDIAIICFTRKRQENRQSFWS